MLHMYSPKIYVKISRDGIDLTVNGIFVESLSKNSKYAKKMLKIDCDWTTYIKHGTRRPFHLIPLIL